MNKISRIPEFDTEESQPNNSAVDTEVELDEEQSTEEESTEEKNTEGNQVEEAKGSDEETSEETSKESEVAQSSKIKIGEQEFEPEELQALITKGAKVAQWEKKMPGFDVDKLMPDYTQKSQRLAKYEKGLAPKKTEQPNLEELGIDEQQVKTFEKVAKSLGFIKQSDIVENSVESQKEYFIETHPEYKPGVVGGDEKWTSLLTEFNLYNWQQHPDRVAELLERAHSEVSKGWVETARNEKVKEVITTKKAQASMAALGGSNKTSAPKAQITNTQLADKYRAMGWAEEDIKEILT